MKMKQGRVKARAKASAQSVKTIRNRRARHDYELGDSLVVGLELTGAETKSLRMGHGQLSGAYVTVKDEQIWLVGSTVNGTTGVPVEEQAKMRTRRLLAKRREIDAMIQAKQQGRTIVPLELLTQGRYIKLRIAIGKGKKSYDKRQALKKRDESRDIDAALKSQR